MKGALARPGVSLERGFFCLRCRGISMPGGPAAYGDLDLDVPLYAIAQLYQIQICLFCPPLGIPASDVAC